MYLSHAYMRNKTVGQKQALYLISYIDANRLGESDITTTCHALQTHLSDIRITYPALSAQATFQNLFEVQDNELLLKTDNLRELCAALKQQF